MMLAFLDWFARWTVVGASDRETLAGWNDVVDAPSADSLLGGLVKAPSSPHPTTHGENCNP
jgi:hypothetical protein